MSLSVDKPETPGPMFILETYLLFPQRRKVMDLL